MTYTPEMLNDLTKVCYEANRAYAETFTGEIEPSWGKLPSEEQQGSLNVVQFHLDNPDAEVSAYHSHWLKQKIADGWEYNNFKDEKTKGHPFVMPFDALPEAKQKQAAITKQLVDILRQ